MNPRNKVEMKRNKHMTAIICIVVLSMLVSTGKLANKKTSAKKIQTVSTIKDFFIKSPFLLLVFRGRRSIKQ